MRNPCLCGDPACPLCFPGNPDYVIKHYRRALVQIANASAGDTRPGQDMADYWRDHAHELRNIARDVLEYI